MNISQRNQLRKTCRALASSCAASALLTALLFSTPPTTRAFASANLLQDESTDKVAGAADQTAATNANGLIAYQGSVYKFREWAEIYIANSDGSGRTNITNNEAAGNHAPAWSPDGRMIAFHSARDGNAEIYLMNADGSGVRRLTNNPANDFSPNWSPDGGKIVFSRGNRSENGRFISQIYVLNIATGTETRLSDNSSSDDCQAWSPDGTKIAFVSGGGSGSVYTMNPDGTARTRLTETYFLPLRCRLGWSPDSRKLVSSGLDRRHEVGPGLSSGLFNINADGTGFEKIPRSVDDDFDPAWSPDGKKIALANSTGISSSIWAINLDGSGRPTLIGADTHDTNISPAWQPISLSSPPALPMLLLSRRAYSSLNTTDATITINRLGNTSGEASVDYTTSDGTASAGTDYVATAGTLHFADGEVSKSINVHPLYDPFKKESKTVNISLSNATGNGVLTTPQTGTLTIVGAGQLVAGQNPLSDPTFFVRQQYQDFLSREPDASGLDFWTRQLTDCGGGGPFYPTPSRCFGKQVDVSSAFFLSIEFQDTGYFVYRLEKAAFGSLPRFDPFMSDTRQVGRGVVVGQGNWRTQLDANRQAFAEEFVARNAFVERYPSSMSAAEYVNALDANTGGTLAASKREALISGLQAGTETRASVLRQVAENAEFKRREFNGAFVLMEYFGYLRRDPDEAGYQFWLAKLNQFKGDYVASEMVKAFITSGEYRQRFKSN